MISPSSYLMWLNGAKPFAKYSTKDKTFNEETNKWSFVDWTDELEVDNGKLKGILDFARVKKSRVVEFVECKIRSNNDLNLDFLIQICFYERITKCKNWKLIVYNRKFDYKEVIYTRQEIETDCKELWEKANKHLDFVEENYEELNREIEKMKENRIKIWK